MTTWRRYLVTATAAAALMLFAHEASPLLAQSRDRQAPTTPTNLRVVAVTAYTVTLAFNPSTDNSGSFSYVVCCANVSSQTFPGVGSTVVYTAGLEANRTFTLRMYARDAAGNWSKPSNFVTFTTLSDNVAPQTPQLSVTDVGPTHVSLAWSAIDDSPNLWHTLYRDGVPVIFMTRNTTGTAFLLEPETTHTFTVRSRDFAGNLSPFSEPVTVTTDPVNPNDHTPPTVPANLYADTFGDLEINLTWTQSTDDFDAQWIIRYDVFVNGVLSDIAIGSGRSIVYGEPGLNTIEVVAIDTAGNRSEPASVLVQLF
jgi:chitodextrinase